MVESSRADNADGLVAGRLEGINLPDLLWMLRGQRKTGVLALRRSDVEKSIYFDEGRIVFATSNDGDDRLGEMLLRQGVISLDQLEEALANLHLGKRLGTLLVEAGSMSAGNLVGGVLAQVRSIVLDLFTWEEGVYRFEEGSLPTDEVITLDMKSNEMLRSGIRRIRSFGRIRRSVGPPRTVYGVTEGWRDAIGGLNLSEAEEQVIHRLERGDESVEQLCRDVLLSNFEIYQTLWVLKVQGVAQEREEQVRWAGEAAYQGCLENEGFAEVMVRLSRGQETGVLYIRRRSEERSFHFRDGSCVFATSSNPDDSLVSYLLTRGVISLRDREETDKRLLSNKRVGTILRELGVIDDADLHEMVRQQLSEIVYDTFRFGDGDYSFVPGELPSIEEITLDATAESLVLAGLRRVTSWARVRRGCCGVEQRLELTPSYMDVLDRMNAGTDEWQVVTALKTAKSPKEVCRIVRLDDFRVCQILWSLRVLGAVQLAEAEVRETDRTAEEAVPTAAPELVVPAPAAYSEDELVARKVDVEELEAASVDEVAPEPAVAIPLEPEAWDPEASDAPPAPTPEQTQIISRDVVEAALRGETTDPPATAEAAVPEPEVPAVEVPGVEIDVPEVDVSGLAAGDSPPASEAFAIEVDVPGVDVPQSDEEVPEIDVPGVELESPGVDVPLSAEAELSPAEDSPPVEREVPAVEEPPQVADEPSAYDPSPLALDATRAISREAVEAELVRTEREDGHEVERPSEATPVEVADDSNIWDLEKSTRTVRLARDEVDAALTPGEPGNDSALDSAEPDEWKDPGNLEAIIAQFNAMQRVVYRTIRAEVGAGAANFIRSCCGTGPDAVDLLAGAELRSDGSWDADGLRRAVRDNRIQDPRLEYQRLIDREIEVLRAHIGERKVIDLERQIEKVEQAAADRG